MQLTKIIKYKSLTVNKKSLERDMGEILSGKYSPNFGLLAILFIIYALFKVSPLRK